MRSVEFVYVDTSAYVKRFARERVRERFARRVDVAADMDRLLLVRPSRALAFLTADAHLAAAASEEELAVETFGV